MPVLNILRTAWFAAHKIKVQSRLENEELQNQAKVVTRASALYKNYPLEVKKVLKV